MTGLRDLPCNLSVTPQSEVEPVGSVPTGQSCNLNESRLAGIGPLINENRGLASSGARPLFVTLSEWEWLRVKRGLAPRPFSQTRFTTFADGVPVPFLWIQAEH